MVDNEPDCFAWQPTEPTRVIEAGLPATINITRTPVVVFCWPAIMRVSYSVVVACSIMLLAFTHAVPVPDRPPG